MSLVGPRPERGEFVDQFQEKIPVIIKGGSPGDSEGTLVEYRERIPYYTQRLSVKPGVTGWAQVTYSYAFSFEQTVEKLEYDLYYIKNMSLLLDCLILLKSIRVVLLGKRK